MAHQILFLVPKGVLKPKFRNVMKSLNKRNEKVDENRSQKSFLSHFS